jgi:hypothetical protein
MSYAHHVDGESYIQWDQYVKAQRYSIFYSTLVKGDDGKFSMSGPLHNAAQDTMLEAPEGMYQPEDHCNNYDLGRKGIIFVARDPFPDKPEHNEACDVYFVPLDSWTAAAYQKPVKITLQGGDTMVGVAFNPRFSPDGVMISYLKKPFANFADTRLMMGPISLLESLDVFKAIMGSSWSLVPSGFEYAPSGAYLHIQAEDCGREALYELPIRHGAEPRLLLRNPSVSAFHPLKDDKSSVQKLLITASSMVDSSIYTVIDTALQTEPRVISTATKHGQKLGLSHSQVSEIWFEGSEDRCVQAWLIKPKEFDETKKWPIILLIHGGPQGSSKDAWHWRVCYVPHIFHNLGDKI